MSQELCAHVILVQRPLWNLCTSLVTVLEMRQVQTVRQQVALTTWDHIRLDHLLHATALTHICFLAHSTHECRGWYGDQQLILGRPIQGRDGYGIVIHMHPRLPPDSTSMLQLGAPRGHVRSPGRETLSLMDLLPEEIPPSLGTAVRIISASDTLQLPMCVEVPDNFEVRDIHDELAAWGQQCRIALFVDYHIAVCFPTAEEPASVSPAMLFMRLDGEDDSFLHLDRQHLPADEVAQMRYLYSQGFWRACIEVVLHDQELPVTLIGFRNCEVTELPRDQRKPRLPWPPRLPVPQEIDSIFDSQKFAISQPDCSLSLGLDLETITGLFSSASNMLCTSFEGLDLPEHIVEALAQGRPLQRVDRLLIFCDGSSLPEQRRRPPLRADEEGK